MIIVIGCKKPPFPVQLPNNLSEAVSILESKIDDRTKKYIQDSKNVKDENKNIQKYLIVELPKFILNSWIYNKNCQLKKWFNQKGISHPDDMASIVIKSLISKVNEDSFDLKEEINRINILWNKKNQPKIHVNSNIIIIPIERSIADLKEESIIHLGFDYETMNTWFYEFDKGWYKPSTDYLKKFDLKNNLSKDTKYSEIVKEKRVAYDSENYR